MVVLLFDIEFGDEIIMFFYIFVFIVNVFVLCGGVLVFVDICEDMFNLDEWLIEEVIIFRIKVIVLVYYVGVVCEMDMIMEIVCCYGLKVVEDVVQGVMLIYKGRVLGSIGDFGVYSFYEIKNVIFGEGGVLLVNDFDMVLCVEIIWEKGIDWS